MPKLSWRSPAVTFLDADQVLHQARTLAREFLAAHPEVQEVRVFGSLVSEGATPLSNLDLNLLVRELDRQKARQLEEAALEAFLPLPLPVQVVLFTPAAFAAPQGLAATVRAQGVTLARAENGFRDASPSG
jgi:predicted nucleotidyltransferase